MNLSVITEPVSTPTEPTRPERYAIDPFRGYVCLGIVALHCYAGMLREDIKTVFGDWFDHAIQYYRLGVESFFLLGGFFIAHVFRPTNQSSLSVKNLLIRRLFRLTIPYWVAIALVCMDRLLVNMLLSHHNEIPSSKELIVQALFVQDLFGVTPVMEILWSMATIVQFYLICTLVFWMIRRWCIVHQPDDYQQCTMRIFMNFCMIVALASAVFHCTDWFIQWHLIRTGAFLAIGVLVYGATHGYCKYAMLWVACAVLIAVGIVGGDYRCFKVPVCVAILVIFARGYTLPNSVIARIFAAIGVWSYSIYLVHGWIGFRVVLFSNHLKGWNMYDEYVAVLLYFAALVASIVFGALFYRLVERPIVTQARQVTYRQ